MSRPPLPQIRKPSRLPYFLGCMPAGYGFPPPGMQDSFPAVKGK